MVDKLTECGKKGPTPLTSVSYDLAFMVHVAEDEREARVDEVTLMSSTLHISEVETCMADALYGMRTPLEALALRRRNLSPGSPVAPETRALLGQAQAVQLLEVMALIVVGYAVYTVIVHVLVDKPRAKPRPRPVTAETDEPLQPLPAATVVPTATAVPIVTAVPTVIPTPVGKSCTDMYVDCREKGPPCDRKLGGKTMCAYCQDNCLADEPYKFKQCTECGFR
ncbi:MAG: hypothetical protein IPK82_11135 [Polyangiaceae bacterium]|nr:hypothetical protein [Polyangiaceae bacterium]